MVNISNKKVKILIFINITYKLYTNYLKFYFYKIFFFFFFKYEILINKRIR